MINVCPLSPLTVSRLEAPPKEGNTHRWLAQISGGLHNVLPRERCFAFLRQCCDEFVKHRAIPDREIQAAVDFAYDVKSSSGSYARTTPTWPQPSNDTIERALNTGTPLFDGVTDSGLGTADVLPRLFRPGELVCTGADTFHPTVRPVEDAVRDADTLQFVCINPMRGLQSTTKQGKPSARCQNNVLLRRHLVAEFDDASRSKQDQAQLVTVLGRAVPLVMAVDSGGKSVHAWFRVEGLNQQDQARFFAVACALGADPTRWDISGWLRMPGGTRLKEDGSRVRQKILYFNRDVANSHVTVSEGGAK